jgi:hypothetical protein
MGIEIKQQQPKRGKSRFARRHHKGVQFILYLNFSEASRSGPENGSKALALSLFTDSVWFILRFLTSVNPTQSTAPSRHPTKW